MSVNMSKKPDSNKDSQKYQRIQVFARIRPINSIEEKQHSPCVVQVASEKKEVKVRDSRMTTKSFGFDKVFGPEISQISVYKAVVGPLIREVLMGYNCTVFAYGQTGSGKTYTMEGERSDIACSWEEDPSAGIVPRSLHQLVEELTMEENIEFSIHVSFLELYNEELFDLLNPTNDRAKLRLFEDSIRKGTVVIQGLEEIKVSTKDEVFSILEKGTMRRQTAETLMNACSSRSHTIFSVTVHIKENTIDGEELLKTGKLNLVDLAGCENISRSGATQKTAREAGNINQSLLTLGRVITALVEKAPHIPYRESKLTRLLQDSLGGHTKTSIIATVSPALCNVEETLSTLEYAQRAKCITIRPEINQKMTKRALIREYTEEIERLKRDLNAQRDKNGFYIDWDNYNAMVHESAKNKDEIEELESRIEALKFEKDQIEHLFADNRFKLHETEIILQDTSKKYKKTTKELSKTKEDLNCTQKALKETIQLRDEDLFIEETIKNNEKQLHQQANVLQQVVVESTNDVFALHNKTDRLKRVEKTNKDLAKEFRDIMQKKITASHDKIQSTACEITNDLEFLKGSITQTTEMWDNQINFVNSFLTTLPIQLNKHIDALQERVANDIEQHTKWCESCVNKCAQHKNMALCELKDFVASYSEMYSTLKSIIAMQNSHFLSLQEQLKFKIEERKQALSTAINENSLRMDDILDTVDKLSSTQLSHLSTVSDVTSNLVEKKKQDRKEIDEKYNLASQALESFKSCCVQQISADVQSLTKVCESTEVASATMKMGEINTKRKIDDVVKHIKCIGSDHVSALDELNASQTNDLKQFNMTESILRNVETTNGKISSYLAQSEQFQVDALRMTEDLMNEEKEDIRKKGTDYQEKLTVCKVMVGNEMSESKARVLEHDSEMKSFITTPLCTVLNAEDTLNQSTLQSKTDFLDMDLQVEKFVSEDMCNDIPTGTTPIRKIYTYPITLTISSPRERILERYHSQNLTQNEAIAINLPLNSSFDDESPEISVTESLDNQVIATNGISDESNGFESDTSLSSQSDVSIRSIKNKENFPMPEKSKSHKASRLPRRKQMCHAKTFAVPQGLPPQRKPLLSCNSDSSAKN